MCNSTSTALRHEKNKTSFADFFSPSILQDQRNSQQTHLLTSNISNHSDKFYLLQIIAPHQHPEAVAQLSLPTHLEKVENNVTVPLSAFQTFSDLVSTTPQKVIQKLTIVVSQIPACQPAPALNGLTNWNNRKTDTAALPWTGQTDDPLPFPLLSRLSSEHFAPDEHLRAVARLHDPRIQPLSTNYTQDGQHLDPRTILLA